MNDLSNEYKGGFTRIPQERDEVLWGIAQRRAGFKISLLSYALVNTFLVIIWYLTSGTRNYFWPIWPIMGWGVGLCFQYFGAYHSHKIFSVEEEYNKLKNNNQSI